MTIAAIKGNCPVCHRPDSFKIDRELMRAELATASAEIARLDDALTLIQRIQHMEGKTDKWCAAQMNACAYAAQNGEDLAWFRRLFPRKALEEKDDDSSKLPL